MQRHIHTRAQTALFWMNLCDVSSRTVFRYTFKNKNSATQIMDKILLKTVSDWEFQWIMKIYDNCLNRNFTHENILDKFTNEKNKIFNQNCN